MTIEQAQNIIDANYCNMDAVGIWKLRNNGDLPGMVRDFFNDERQIRVYIIPHIDTEYKHPTKWQAVVYTVTDRYTIL